MASVNQRGILSDLQRIGWGCGKYRMVAGLAVTALESGAGMALIFIMHISRIMQKDFQIGEEVKAGTLIGFMGDTGYRILRYNRNFPVHLHFGVYFDDESGKEFSVNPFPLLRYLKIIVIESRPMLKIILYIL